MSVHIITTDNTVTYGVYVSLKKKKRNKRGKYNTPR